METVVESLSYKCVATLSALSAAQQALVAKANEALKSAYAPYSHFRVGAAARLDSGQIVLGSNHENASFPAGICAERSAVFSAASLCPTQKILSIAIVSSSAELKPVAPCGICRQVLAETEAVQQHIIELLLVGSGGQCFVFESVAPLLPLHFMPPALKR